MGLRRIVKAGLPSASRNWIYRRRTGTPDDILLSPRIAGSNTPLKLLDYLKTGRAIVACDNPANRLILDDSTSRLVAPDPEAFAGAIAALAADPLLRERLGDAGRQLHLTTYNYARYKQLLGDAYRQLLGAAAP